MSLGHYYLRLQQELQLLSGTNTPIATFVTVIITSRI